MAASTRRASASTPSPKGQATWASRNRAPERKGSPERQASQLGVSSTRRTRNRSSPRLESRYTTKSRATRPPRGSMVIFLTSTSSPRLESSRKSRCFQASGNPTVRPRTAKTRNSTSTMPPALWNQRQAEPAVLLRGPVARASPFKIGVFTATLHR